MWMHDSGKALPAANHLQDNTTVTAVEHKSSLPLSRLSETAVNLLAFIKRTDIFDYFQSNAVKVLYSLH